LKNKFQLEQEGWDYIFCGILEPAAIQDCTNNNECTPAISDIINRVCYQRN